MQHLQEHWAKATQNQRCVMVQQNENHDIDYVMNDEDIES
jgi:hypothetical protein